MMFLLNITGFLKAASDKDENETIDSAHGHEPSDYLVQYTTTNPENFPPSRLEQRLPSTVSK